MRSLAAVAIRAFIYVVVYQFIVLLVDKPILPSATKIAAALDSRFLVSLATDLLPTCLRWCGVFLAGSAAGALLGLVLGYNSRSTAIVTFDLDFWRSLPATALVPFCFALFGDNEITRVFPAFYITLFTVLYYVAKSSNAVSKDRLQHLRTLGAGEAFVLRHCYCLEILPSLMVALRQAVSLSFLVLVSSELIVGSSGNHGVGNRIVDWLFYTQYEQVIAMLIILGTMGYLANLLMKHASAKVLYWRPAGE